MQTQGNWVSQTVITPIYWTKHTVKCKNFDWQASQPSACLTTLVVFGIFFTHTQLHVQLVCFHVCFTSYTYQSALASALCQSKFLHVSVLCSINWCYYGLTNSSAMWLLLFLVVWRSVRGAAGVIQPVSFPNFYFPFGTFHTWTRGISYEECWVSSAYSGYWLQE